MNLNIPFHFIQVLLSEMKHSTKDEYFPNHNYFTMIYLLPKQGLNHK
jgi:hypothetical protein